MSNIGEQIRRIAERKKAMLGEVVKEAVRDLAGQMIDNSPVTSGKFKNNWKGSVGTLDTDTSAESASRYGGLPNARRRCWAKLSKKPSATLATR